jgi:cytochrome c oxidase subunit 3
MKKKFILLDVDVKKLKTSKSFKAERHGYHIVEPSPWPFIIAKAIANLVMLYLYYFHYFIITKSWAFFVILFFPLVIGMWFRDMILESTFQSMYTLIVQKMLRAGFVLVLLSEAIFFFGFFWCFFYMAISPSIWIGCVWPPFDIIPIHSFGIPLVNTIVLVSSVVIAVFVCGCVLQTDERFHVIHGLCLSIMFGVVLILLQIWEHINVFVVTDGIYSSVFFQHMFWLVLILFLASLLWTTKTVINSTFFQQLNTKKVLQSSSKTPIMQYYLSSMIIINKTTYSYFIDLVWEWENIFVSLDKIMYGHGMYKLFAFLITGSIILTILLFIGNETDPVYQSLLEASELFYKDVICFYKINYRFKLLYLSIGLLLFNWSGLLILYLSNDLNLLFIFDEFLLNIVIMITRISIFIIIVSLLVIFYKRFIESLWSRDPVLAVKTDKALKVFFLLWVIAQMLITQMPDDWFR